MADIIPLPVITTLDIPPERILAGAQKADLTAVVVIGINEDGEYFASSIADGADVVWMLERVKLKLLRLVD